MNTCGKLNTTLPETQGLEFFQGTVLFGTEAALSADLRGKRVAIVGDGTTEVDVTPYLVGKAEKVKVFQRDPVWLLPDPDYLRSVLPEKWLERVARIHLHRQARDPWIRRQLTPDGPLDRHRVQVSSDYYPALQKPGCELITWPVVTICEQGIRTAEGIEHRFDCIVVPAT